MSDLLHRLNPFRPASPAKPPPHSQLRTSSPIRKRTKSPHHLTLYLERDRPDSAAGHLPSRASSSLESPLPDVPYGRYLLDTQRSMDLDRPVFTPVPSSPSHSPYPHTDPPPTTTPGRRARTPSILRTLAHHPSLSALKGKQKREKKREVEEREERLSGSVDDEVPERDEEERKGWMGTWGSAKKKRARKGSLKLAKSMPSVRTSDESDDYRSSMDVPVPALPEMYVKRTSKGIDFSKALTPDIEICLEGYETPVSPTRIAPRASTSPMRMPRTRGKSEDLSPKRQPILPRHLSTPAKADRGYSPSPPRLSLPAPSQHPHPVPLDWTRRDSIEEYDPSNYGDRPGTPEDLAGQLEDGLDILRLPEELPDGTPGGTTADKRRGMLSDGAKHEKGSIRFFSRDTYARLSESPSESPRPSPCPTPTLTIPNPAGLSPAQRAESPFEVKLSPLVTKRMSLEVFGPTLGLVKDDGDKRESLQSLAESVEEMDDDQFELDEEKGVATGLIDLAKPNTLEGWTGTQLTTIAESPSSVHSTAYLAQAQSTPSAPTQAGGETGPTAYYTPDSHSTSTGTDSSYSPVPVSLSRQLIQAHTDHTRQLDARVREGEVLIAGLREEIAMLKKELEDESCENEAAWKVVDEMQADLKQAEASSEEKHQALESMRQAMVENEEFFDQLQEAHDNLAERFERMEMALTNGAEVREKQADQIAALGRTNGELVLASAALRKDKLDLESQLHESTATLEARTKELNDAARQLEVTVEEYTTHLADCDRRAAEMGVRVSEVDTLRSLLSLRESELEASQAAAVELREEMRGWERKLVEKDMVLQQLRDKVGTKQFEVDEGRVEAEGEIMELRAKLDRALQERGELMEQLNTAKDSSGRTTQLEDDNTRLEEDVQELQFLYEESLNQLEAARSEIEAQVGDMSLQQGEVKQLRADLEATQESLARVTAQSTRAQREHDRTASDLKWKIDDLRTQLADQETKVRVAFVEREMSSATTADVQSRLTAYLGEIDRLKLAETKLLSEVGDLRAASSGETLRVVELEKRIKELEEDKMLMDISLDNKETEITLLNRQASRSGSVTPTRKRLVASTSRIPSTPSASTIARPGETPGPNRRLSVSMHGSTIKRPVSAAGAAKSGRRRAPS